VETFIRNTVIADFFAVEELTRDAFWDTHRDPGDAICDEHLLVHRLRKCPSYVPQLDFVAEIDGKIIGHIIYSKCRLVDTKNKSHEMLTFGPLTVAKSHQNMGVGKRLIAFSFDRACHLGYRAVIIFGHPGYYPRAGFGRGADFGITDSEGGSYDALMVYPLFHGALNNIAGKVILDPVYESLTQEDVLEFDKRFPPRLPPVRVKIGVLLERLQSPARKAIEGLNMANLNLIQTKSEREISALEGISETDLITIREVMREHDIAWGDAK
jgi:predicted N-acetyltransferase YhbS